MSVENVELAIRHCRRVVGEWEDINMNGWREDQTRYAVIDPILRALGWDTADPKECMVEYRRGRGWVDYAIFGEEAGMEGIGRAEARPLIVIEAKPVDADLTEVPDDQLAGYVDAEPAMQYGAGVVTNGRLWMIFDLEAEGALEDKHIETVNITEGAVLRAATTLNYWLSKEQW